jgi:PTS system mannose-specific IIA component
MIGIVVVTHGKLADEFVAATEHVVGKQTQIKAVCIQPEDDMEQKRTEIENAVSETSTGEGVVILTDMFGGTPSNLAISVMNDDSVEMITGVNLPMMIRLASVRATLPFKEAMASAQEAGRKYINVASALLGKS